MKYFKPHTIVSVVVDKNDDNVNIILGLHVKSGGNRVKNTAKQKNKQTGLVVLEKILHGSRSTDGSLGFSH